MKTVTIIVTDETAQKLVTLAKTGRVSGRRGAAYGAFKLLTEHSRPTWRDFPGRTTLREIVVDGVTYVAPSTLSYGGLTRHARTAPYMKIGKVGG
jgi:hypothetical protein